MAGIAGSQANSLAQPVPGEGAPQPVVQAPAAQPMPAPLPAPAPAPAQQQAGPSDDDLLAGISQHAAGPSDDELLYGIKQHAEPGFLDRAKTHMGKVWEEFKARPLETALKTYDAFEDHKLNASLLGHLPQVKGAVGAAVGAAGGSTTYTSERDAASSQLAQQSSDSPVASMAGSVDGAVGMGAATAGAGGAATVAGTVARGAVSGGIMGLATNPGDKQGEINPLQLKERLTNGGIGALVGGALSLGTHAIAKGFEKALAVLPRSAPAPSDPGVILPEQGAQAALADAMATNEAAKNVGTQLRPDELFPNDPDLAAAHAKALASKSFQEAQLARAKGIVGIVDKLKGAFNAGDETVGTAIDKLAAADKLHGEGIGAFRDEVIKNSEAPTRELSIPGHQYTQQTFLSALPSDAERATQLGHNMANPGMNQAIDKNALDTMSKGEISSLGQQASFEPGKTKLMRMPETQSTLKDMRQSFGFVDGKDGGYTRPDAATVKDIANRLNMPTSKAFFFVDKLAKLTDQISNDNGLSPRAVDGLYNDFKAMANAHAPAAGETASATFANAVKLKDAFRDDFTTGAGSFLGADSQQAYQAHMARYSALKQLPAGVTKLLRAGEPAQADVLAWMDRGALNNKAHVDAFMGALRTESPEAAEAVSQGYTAHLFDKFVEQDTATAQRVGGFDWPRMRAHLDKAANFERLQSVVGEEHAGFIYDVATAGKAISEADKPFQQAAGMLKYVKAMVSLSKADGDQAVTILGADRSAQKLLAGGAMQKVVARMASKDKAAFMQLYNRAISQAGAQGATQNQRVQDQP